MSLADLLRNHIARREQFLRRYEAKSQGKAEEQPGYEMERIQNTPFQGCICAVEALTFPMTQSNCSRVISG